MGVGRSARPEQRILVLDDEAAIAELHQIALRYEGFAIATAADGALSILLPA